VLEPHIRQAAGNNHIHGHAMKAINGDENIRNKVMEGNKLRIFFSKKDLILFTIFLTE
jgi:hypothetical protein